jgi:NAD(P)-dependent dehydrogenase (short-subunit alcohol dehydrogenase family)
MVAQFANDTAQFVCAKPYVEGAVNKRNFASLAPPGRACAVTLPCFPARGNPVSTATRLLENKEMIIDLTGKRAIVTGSTAGIGFATAKGLALSGAAVTLNGRSEKSVDEATRRLREAAPKADVQGIAADLASAEGVAAFLARAGDADILVNNLGIFEPTAFEAITDEDWQRFFDTNVMSGVRLTRHYLARMVGRGWGRIVFISSESGLNIPTEMIHYGMTKTAQLAISRGVAESVAGTGVTVNSVLPGPTRSEGVSDFFGKMANEAGVSQQDMEQQFIAKHRPTSLLRRLATPEEVANIVVYVCSPQASATTGAALRVDGGVVRSIV